MSSLVVREELHERRGRGDRGNVLILTAMMLTQLIAFTGFAVESSYWQMTSAQMQRSVDAAALGGVVFMPADFPTARDIAEDLLSVHGVVPSDDVTITIAPGPHSNQLRVTVEMRLDTIFLSVAGLQEVTLTRSALAAFEGPVPMGSPINVLGNDPENPPMPDFWLNIAAPNAPRNNGDRFAAKICTSSEPGCTGQIAPPVANDDYSTSGYTYVVEVPEDAVGTEPLRIQVFDGAFTRVGDQCDRTVFPTTTQRNTLAQLPDPQPGWWDDVSRYVGGITIWCTGDQNNGGIGNLTTVIVRAPDETPWLEADNQLTSCIPQSMPTVDPSTSTIYRYLHPSDGSNDPGGIDAQGVVNANDGVLTFAETFRRWATVCEIPAGELVAGKYLVQIRTNARAASPLVYDPTFNNGGHNRFSMRAGIAAGTEVDAQGIRLYASGRLPLYANATAANAEFYLARISPTTVSRGLTITFWDMGDATQPGTLQILAPPDSNIPGGVFSGCVFERSDGAPLSTNTNTCQLYGISSSSGYNARIVRVRVPLVNGYTCDVADPFGCWVRVRMSFPGGVSDTTTWSADMAGAPVRLVE